MDEIKIASEMRHDIIHGVATFHPEGATQIEMVRILRDAERGSAKHFTVTAIQVLEPVKSTNLPDECLSCSTCSTRLLRRKKRINAPQFIPRSRSET